MEAVLQLQKIDTLLFKIIYKANSVIYITTIFIRQMKSKMKNLMVSLAKQLVLFCNDHLYR
jgi:hypothetical protein